MKYIFKFTGVIACAALLTVSTIGFSKPVQAGDLLGGIGKITKNLKYLKKKDKKKCLDDNPLLSDLPAGELAKACADAKKEKEGLEDAASKE